MISCGYNGWTDSPEDEREGLDTFEAARSLPAGPPTNRPFYPRTRPQRKAA